MNFGKQNVLTFKNNVPDWTYYNDEIVENIHGQVKMYRDLYYGNHGEVFERAKELIEKGEIVDNILKGRTQQIGNVRIPYVQANMCKLICEVPAFLVSRAVGKIGVEKEQTFAADNRADTDNDGKVTLTEIIEDIVRHSKLQTNHKTNILQAQIDGGIIGIPTMDENGLRIDFKKRELYYPHEDGNGCDVVYKRNLVTNEETGEMEEFIQVHRERIEDKTLTVEQILYSLEDNKLQPLEEDEAKLLLGLDELSKQYAGRTRPFVAYWGVNKTFDYELGMSALHNQDSKQDEINWTLTQNAIVYQRNGKPRLAVSKEIYSALQQKAYDRYGDDDKIDHRDLEITTIDENGKSIEVVQIDVTKMGGIPWVKDLVKLMLMETQTSEKAIDFYMDGQSNAQSGVAKFYDLFTSIIKAEHVLDEYIEFLQELFENVFWLLKNEVGFEELEIVTPTVQIKDIIPTTAKETIDKEVAAKEGGVRSQYKAVRNVNPNDSDEAIEQEVEDIKDDSASTNSNPIGANTMAAMLDGRNKPLVDPNNPEDGNQDPNNPKGGKNPSNLSGDKGKGNTNTPNKTKTPPQAK
ncbi:hypothetical protein PBC5_003 [Bacillus phage PBC5]|nr:hypothetical protein PBC5_003 [Bacillus phage PBC5]